MKAASSTPGGGETTNGKENAPQKGDEAGGKSKEIKEINSKPAAKPPNKNLVPGGLQIKRSDMVEERPSKFRVGGITSALLEIPENVTQQLMPQQAIHKDEPVFPTDSRFSRLKEKEKDKDTCCFKCAQRAAKLDLWAIQTIPHIDVIAFQICIFLAPVLLIVTVWDVLGVTIFMIPHFTSLNRPGFLYSDLCFLSRWYMVGLAPMMVLAPFYPIGTVASFYGYMMRFLMEDLSRKTKICLAGVFVYPALLVLRCTLHYFFNGYRDERKLWY